MRAVIGAAALCGILGLTTFGCGGGTTTGGGTDGGGHDSGGGDGGGGTDGGSGDDGGGGTDGGGGVDGGGDVDGGGTDAGASDVDSGGSLTTCGGRGGGVCTGNEYCDYEGAGGTPCGWADGTGVCRARPTTCTPDDSPVCGCDGNDYASPCEAAMAGSDVAMSGMCVTAGTTFDCGPSLMCMTDVEYCSVVMGGPAGSMPHYACSPLPPTCTGGVARPSCATCFPGSTGPGSCTDGGPGEITVTIFAP